MVHGRIYVVLVSVSTRGDFAGTEKACIGYVPHDGLKGDNVVSFAVGRVSYIFHPVESGKNIERESARGHHKGRPNHPRTILSGVRTSTYHAGTGVG